MSNQTPNSVASGAQLYLAQRPGAAVNRESDLASAPAPTNRTYTADEVRKNAVLRGRAVYDAARGNQSAKDALKDAAAVATAVAALDPLMLQPPGQPGTDVTPPPAA